MNPTITLYVEDKMQNQKIDLIVEAARKVFIIEIKSAEKVDLDQVKKMAYFKTDFPKATFLFLSQDQNEFNQDGILCWHWQSGLELLKNL